MHMLVSFFVVFPCLYVAQVSLVSLYPLGGLRGKQKDDKERRLQERSLRDWGMTNIGVRATIQAVARHGPRMIPPVLLRVQAAARR